MDKDKDCGFFTNGQFLSVSGFFLLRPYNIYSKSCFAKKKSKNCGHKQVLTVPNAKFWVNWKKNIDCSNEHRTHEISILHNFVCRVPYKVWVRKNQTHSKIDQ